MSRQFAEPTLTLVHLGLHEGRESPEGVEDVTDDLAERDFDPEPFRRATMSFTTVSESSASKVAVEPRLRPEVIGLVLDVQRDHHDALDLLEDRRRDLGRSQSYGFSSSVVQRAGGGQRGEGTPGPAAVRRPGTPARTITSAGTM